MSFPFYFLSSLYFIDLFRVFSLPFPLLLTVFPWYLPSSHIFLFFLLSSHSFYHFLSLNSFLLFFSFSFCESFSSLIYFIYFFLSSNFYWPLLSLTRGQVVTTFVFSQWDWGSNLIIKLYLSWKWQLVVDLRRQS